MESRLESLDEDIPEDAFWNVAAVKRSLHAGFVESVWCFALLHDDVVNQDVCKLLDNDAGYIEPRESSGVIKDSKLELFDEFCVRRELNAVIVNLSSLEIILESSMNK